jgi:hypothetical protein
LLDYVAALVLMAIFALLFWGCNLSVNQAGVCLGEPPTAAQLGILLAGQVQIRRIRESEFAMGTNSSESTTILLVNGVATRYSPSVNRNIFYIIGVIVVIVVVLKMLHVF